MINQSKYNIGLIIPYFYPDLGGAETYAFEICKYLSRYFNVHVLASGNTYRHFTYSNYTNENNTIYISNFYRQIIASNTPLNINLHKIIDKWLDYNNIDLILSSTPVPITSDISLMVGKRKNIPRILFYHNILRKRNSTGDFIAKLYNLILNNITLYIPNLSIISSIYGKCNNNYFSKFKIKGKYMFIAPGIDDSIIDPPQNPKIISKKQINLVTITSLKPSHSHKRVDIILKAVSAISEKDVVLDIIGEGELKEEYTKIVSKLNIEDKVRFHGRISEVEKINTLKAADIFILLSENDNEGFGIVYLEACAVGVPCIGTNVGGVPYIFDHNVGIMIEPNNIELTKNAILELSSNQEFYNSCVSNCIKLARKHTWSNLLTGFENICYKMIEDKKYLNHKNNKVK